MDFYIKQGVGRNILVKAPLKRAPSSYEPWDISGVVRTKGDVEEFQEISGNHRNMISGSQLGQGPKEV